MKKHLVWLSGLLCAVLLWGCAGGKEEGDAEPEAERKEQGVSAYAAQNASGGRAWYPDADAFLREFGFSSGEPFYEYYDSSGSLQMALYYDSRSGAGCGLRYYKEDPTMFTPSGVYGFAFDRTGMKEWDGWETDYHTVPASPIFKEAENWLADCRDYFAYDETGRIQYVEAKGVLTGMGDTESSTLLRIDFTYHANGRLKRRLYRHNMNNQGTYGAIVDSCFDEQERLLYEYRYVTHGCEDYYFIYGDDGETPAYCLMLDFNTGDWIPEFTAYRGE